MRIRLQLNVGDSLRFNYDSFVNYNYLLRSIVSFIWHIYVYLTFADTSFIHACLVLQMFVNVWLASFEIFRLEKRFIATKKIVFKLYYRIFKLKTDCLGNVWKEISLNQISNLNYNNNLLI